MRISFFIALFFLPAFSNVIWASESDSIVNKIFTLIYNEKYSEAHIEIAKNTASVDPFYVDVLKIDLRWWEFKRDKKKQEALTSFLEQFDDTARNKQELKLKQLIKTSYQVRYELKRYHIIGAIKARSSLKKLLDEITSEKLPYPENKAKLLDLYSSLFQYFDNLINPLFNKEKRDIREKALKETEKYTHDNDLIIKTLSLYFLGRIYLGIEHEEEKGHRCFTELSAYYPNNSYFKEMLNN
mgnify:CR=1 FL=1